MLCSDSRRQEFDVDILISNNDAINNNIISEIEKNLQENPYDMISLVFLLYDDPNTALQRLIVFEQVSKDLGSCTIPNLLQEWYQRSKQTPTWKHEFVEALLLCQLNSIVRKLGFHVPSARNHYQTDTIQVKMYINPVKKALYKVCENMTMENLFKLRMALLRHDIDTIKYNNGEVIFLKLMCDKFITLNQYQYNKKEFGLHVQLDKLLEIIKSLPGLQKLAEDINTLQQEMNVHFQPSAPMAVSTPSEHMKVDEPNDSIANINLYCNDFNEIYGIFENLNLEGTSSIKSLKSDRMSLPTDCYKIKNHKSLGVCVILNQVNFYPSKSSMTAANSCVSLGTRIGSEKDEARLVETMSKLNFSIHNKTDLDHNEMFVYLKKIITDKVSPDDSVFMLCILSHGVKGHIYAADSVQVDLEKIQNLLDSDFAINLHNKPKILIVQACQDEEAMHPLVTDSPNHNNWNYKNKQRKTDCIVCWATAPELQAFRYGNDGSIFIQILCHMLLKYAKAEHIGDIFTRVTDAVQHICSQLHCKQIPIRVTTLRKKLFLQATQFNALENCL